MVYPGASPFHSSVLDASILARLEGHWAGRQKGERSQGWIDWQLAKVHASLKAMSQGLGDKPYCAGIYLSLADIAVGCALGYLDFRFGTGWRNTHPKLVKWLHEFANKVPAFADTTPH